MPYSALLPLITEPEDFLSNGWLTKTRDKNIVIVDLCSEQTYSEGHIPGAYHLAPARTTRGSKPPGLLPELAQLQSIIDDLGLDQTSHIVVYDDEGGGWAGRFIWLLDSLGLYSYAYLNGGRPAWLAAGGELNNETPSPRPKTEFKASINLEPSVEKEEIMFLLGAPGSMQVWDARSPEEHRGEKVLAERGGHIPSAINGNWLDFMDRDRNLKIRLDAKEYLSSIGIHGDKPIITHCQTHHRSGLSYLIGKSLDFDIRAYPGSWSEWGNTKDTPIEI